MCVDTFIQRTKKLYLDTRTQRNINKLSEDLVEVHSIMTKNIQDVLGQGEALNSELPSCLPDGCTTYRVWTVLMPHARIHMDDIKFDQGHISASRKCYSSYSMAFVDRVWGKNGLSWLNLWSGLAPFKPPCLFQEWPRWEQSYLPNRRNMPARPRICIDRWALILASRFLWR